jgi:alkylhydroperoxidase family enzyme
MARIPYPEPGSIPTEVSSVLSQMPEHPSTKMLSHAHSLTVPFLRLLQAHYIGVSLPPRDRELAILTVASLGECEIEWTQHVGISESVGVSSEACKAIRSRDYESAGLGERDRLIIRFVKETLEKPRVSDGVFSEVCKTLSPRETAELLVVTGTYWSFGRFCTVLDIDIVEPNGVASLQAMSQLTMR